MLSGKDCLVLALSKSTFRHSDFLETEWTAAREQVDEGHSLQFARLFDIDETQFPAVLFFKDVRSGEYVIISLKDMSEKVIGQKMRVVFKLIREAIDEQKNPLEALEKNRKMEALKYKGKQIVSAILTAAVPITLKIAMETLLKEGLGIK